MDELTQARAALRGQSWLLNPNVTNAIEFNAHLEVGRDALAKLKIVVEPEAEEPKPQRKQTQGRDRMHTGGHDRSDG